MTFLVIFNIFTGITSTQPLLSDLKTYKFRASFQLHLIFEIFTWFSCFSLRLSSAMLDVFFNYIYIMIVEHINKDTFVFNTVIYFNRDDQFHFIFIFNILIFFSFDCYAFIWFCNFVSNKRSDCIPESPAYCKVLIFGNVLKVSSLVFLVSVLHLFFNFLW